MTRGPRTPQGIAAVTRTIQRVNVERRKVRQPSTGSQDIYATGRVQSEVRALAAQIVGVLEGEGQGFIRPADRVMIELLAIALALARTRLTQDKDRAATSCDSSAASSRSPGAQETGKVANVRPSGPGGRGKVAASLPDAARGPAVGVGDG